MRLRRPLKVIEFCVHAAQVFSASCISEIAWAAHAPDDTTDDQRYEAIRARYSPIWANENQTKYVSMLTQSQTLKFRLKELLALLNQLARHSRMLQPHKLSLIHI